MFSLSCAAAHVAKKKRRTAVSNCRTVIFNVISVIYTFDGNQAAGLWTLVWRVDVG